MVRPHPSGPSRARTTAARPRLRSGDAGAAALLRHSACAGDAVTVPAGAPAAPPQGHAHELQPLSRRPVAASRAMGAAGCPVLDPDRGHPDPAAAGCPARAVSASGCPGRPAGPGIQGPVRAAAVFAVALRALALPSAFYLGWTRGSPPGVPGGGITGVVPGSGFGAGAWMPGSTPAGGRITPTPPDGAPDGPGRGAGAGCAGTAAQPPRAPPVSAGWRWFPGRPCAGGCSAQASLRDTP